LSVVAALDLVGRIGGSALSDLHFMPRKYYYIGGLALSGAMLAFIPLIATAGYTSLSIACAVFGLGSGTYVGVTAVLMADMLGAERLASSFGMSLFLNGVLQLLGPPVCGLALQRLQSYTPIFTMLGIVLLIGAAMWGFIPLIERKRRQENKELV
jgi:MFS family permease